MFNDDPYSRQRGKTQQGMVGGAPVVARPPGAPITNPMQPQTPALATPVLQRPIAPRAPLAGMSIGPDRSTGAGASGTWPPQPMAPASAVARPPNPAASLSMTVPPPAAKLSRSPANGLLDLSQPLMNPSDAPVFGQAAQDAAKETGGGLIAGGVRAMRTAALTGAGMAEMGVRGVADAVSGGVGAAKDAAGIIGNEVAIGMGAPPTTLQGSAGIRRPTINQPPAAAVPQISGNASGHAGLTRAPVVPGPGADQQSTYMSFQGDGRSGKANEAAPGQVALSEKRTLPDGTVIGGRQLPGKPLVGADGSVQYDQAWADKNKALLNEYAGKNVLPSGTTAPGVAQSMVSGQTPALGGLARPAQRFTQADRVQQLEAIRQQGSDYAASQASDEASRSMKLATQAARNGDPRAAQLLSAAQTAAGFSQGLQTPPMKQPDPNDAARLGMEQQRLLMDQQKANAETEQMQVQTQADRVQAQQAQLLAGLNQKIVNGTPDERKTAAATIAQMTGQKPDRPIQIVQQRPITDSTGGITMQNVTSMFYPDTGELKSLEPQRTLYGQIKNNKDGKTYNLYSDGTREEVQQ